MTQRITASLIGRTWRRADIKLTLDGEMHILRWRREISADRVYFDERLIAEARGLIGRETMFGLAPRTEAGDEVRLLLAVDPGQDYGGADWSGESRIRGVRLETAEAVLVAEGSYAPSRVAAMGERFSDLFDRAMKSLGV